MSFRLMKERIKVTGHTPREEMIRDGQNLLKEELKHDISYSPTMYFYDSINKQDDRHANFRVYERKYSSLNGNYMNFLTTYDNPVKIGDYIHDKKDDTYWLVYNAFNVNDIQYQGKLIQCNYLLKWQLSDGTIVERWANIVSASKCDTGVSENNTLILTSNNFTILIGFCEEGFELEGKRIFIDKRDDNPTKVFKITRSDDVLFDSDNIGSLLSFIADKAELSKDRDRQDLKLCDYINQSTSLLDFATKSQIKNKVTVNARILGNKNLKLGVPLTYTATLSDKDGNRIDWDHMSLGWNVVGDFDINKNTIENKIELYVENDDYLNSSFFLQLIDLSDNSVITEIEITIIDIG